MPITKEDVERAKFNRLLKEFVREVRRATGLAIPMSEEFMQKLDKFPDELLRTINQVLTDRYRLKREMHQGRYMWTDGRF